MSTLYPAIRRRPSAAQLPERRYLWTSLQDAAINLGVVSELMRTPLPNDFVRFDDGPWP